MSLFSPQQSITESEWLIIDDRVMGGVSLGTYEMTDEGHVRYHGEVSTANNGGFSSLRYRFPTIALQGHQKISLTIKSDGKRYQLRLKDQISNYASYVQSFDTEEGWQTLTFDLGDFYPSFRGRRLQMENFQRQELSEIGFLIGNKKEESFQLEIKSIVLE